jgi:hypothetical protein
MQAQAAPGSSALPIGAFGAAGLDARREFRNIQPVNGGCP